jgi:hypothetical protein
MVLLKVQPDRQYVVAHEVFRLSPLDAAVPPNMVPIYRAKEVLAAIEKYHRLQQWTVLERVPRRKVFPSGRACCDQLAQPSGSPIVMRFSPSDYQGDTDDAHNFGIISDSGLLEASGVIDWTATLHFWQPALIVNLDDEREARAALTEGFMPWEAMPEGAWPELRKRFVETLHDN